MNRMEGRANLWPLRILFTLGGAAGAALLPFFSLYLRDHGLDPERIGLVLAATSLAGAAATPFWSHLADTRLGTIRVLQLSSLGTVVAALGLWAGGSTWLAIVPVAALMSVFSAPSTPLSDALAVGYLGPGRMTEYGRIRLWASLGWAIAVIAFGVLFERVGLGPVLPAYAAGTLAFGLWTLRLPAGAPLPVASESRLGALGDVLRTSPRLAPFLAAAFLVSLASSAAWAFFALRVVGRGGGPFLVGLAAGLTAFVEIPVMRATSSLGKRFGLRALYATGALVYALVFLSWAFIRDPLVLALVASVDGVAFAFVYVGVVVIVGHLVPERLLATGQSLAQLFGWSVTPIIGASVGGFVFARLGAPALFGGASALCVAGASLVWLVLPAMRPGDDASAPANGGTLHGDAGEPGSGGM
jgi:PPP family 3-phenylpropionic acid transporter